MLKKTKIIVLSIMSIVLMLNFLYPARQVESAQSGEIEILSSSEQGLKFTINVDWRSLSTALEETEAGAFSEVTLPGWQQSNQPGTPKLPFMTQAFGVPFGVELAVRVVPGKSHIVSLSAPVLPAAKQVMTQNDPSDLLSAVSEFVVEADVLIYGQDQPYPAKLAEITNDGTLRQQRVASLGIFPLQYLPESDSLVIYESLQVEVLFEGQADLTSAAAVESQVYESVFETQLMNYELAKTWRKKTGSTDLSALAWQPPEPGWRIAIREDGMYRLTYNELAAAGLPVETLDPQTLQMFCQGQEIAIQVHGEEDGSFDQTDEVVFYAEAIDSKYTEDNAYWLTYGSETGLRMDVRDSATIGAPVDYYTAEEHMEENHLYRSILPGGDELERFYWDPITSTPLAQTTWSRNIWIEEPSEGEGLLRIAMFGSLQLPAFDPDHHVIVSLNDTVVADLEWDGLTWAEDGVVEAEIPDGVLQAGVNTLSLFLPVDTGATMDFILMDWATITYPSAFSVPIDEDQLYFTYEANETSTFQVSGFGSDDILAYDLSDAHNLAEIDRESLVIVPDGATYTITFADEALEKKDYWVGTEAAIATVPTTDIIEDQPSELQSADNKADYILIAHPAFWSQAETLAAHRSSQGMDTVLVDIQDVYDEFGYGIVGPTAIRNFLEYAAEYWQAPAPSYVVLLGDGNYDPKNYMGHNRTSFIPPYLAMVDPWIGETAADSRYVAFSGPESIPDMMMGRLSVTTPAEANAFVQKIIAYELSPADGNWSREVLAVAGKADSAGNFDQYSDNLLDATLPDQYEAERVYYGVTHTDVTEAVAALKSGINQGKLIVNFIGHGFARGWQAEKLVPKTFIQTADVPGFTNQDKYPIFLAMTCTEGYYIDPTVQAFGEVVTKAENKGAIASWSPTGQGVSSGHDYMDRGFFDAVFKHGAYVLGEAVLGGFSRLWFSGSSLYLMETYELFGDPALVINRTPVVVDDFYGVAEDFTLIVPAENGVLKNDFGFLPANELTASVETDVTEGELTLLSDGSFTYIPAKDWFGQEEFTYNAFDNGVLIGTARVTISVYSINDTPVAYAQSIETMVDTAVEIYLTGSDADGDALTYTITKYPDHGTLTAIVPPAAITGEEQILEPGLIYEPDEGYSGSDSFVYFVSDGKSTSTPAAINITVLQDIMLIFLPLVMGQ